MDNVSADRADVQEWAVDVRATASRLQDQRQRCGDIPRDGNYVASFSAKQKLIRKLIQDPPTALQDRIIQACNAAWTASVAYELNRLHSNLVEIDPELAEQLRSSAADCFPTGSGHYYARVLKNVF